MKHLGYIFSALLLGAALGQGATAFAGQEEKQAQQELAEARSFFQQTLVEKTGQGVATRDRAQSADAAPDEGSGEVVPPPFGGFDSELLDIGVSTGAYYP